MINKIYNKIISNKKNTICFFLVLTLLSSIPLFIIPGLKVGSDIDFHLSRIYAIASNIKKFKFFNGIYSDYLNGYGYGSGLFYPDIFLYVPAALTALGINIVTSYKLFIILINFLSIISIYISITGISKNKKAGLLGSIIYAFASYRLTDIYSRAALGEVLVFIFAPLIIYGIYEIIFNDYKKYYYLAIGMTGLILSHIISILIIGILLLILCIINIKRLLKEKQRIKYLLLASFVTLLITSFFILPMLEQMASQTFVYSKYTSLSNNTILSNNVVPIYCLFVEIPYFSLLFTNNIIPPGIGIIFIYILYKIIKNKKANDSFLKQSSIISIFFLVLVIIPFIWKSKTIIKLLGIIQFPWRLYLIPTILLTITGSIVLTKTKMAKKTVLITILLAIIPLIVNTYSYINKLKEVPLDYYIAGAEYLPIEIDEEYINDRGNVITSDGELTYKFNKKGTDMKINIEKSKNSTYIEIPYIYYKGYCAETSNENLPVFKTKNGLVGINIENISEGTIKVSYPGTFLAQVTKIISILSFIIFIVIIRKNKQKNMD